MNWCFESLLWVHCLLSSYNILFLSECLLIKLQNVYQFHHINYRFVSLTTLLHTKLHVNFFDVISLFFCRHFLLHRARYLSFSFSQTQNIRTILTTAWTLVVSNSKITISLLRGGGGLMKCLRLKKPIQLNAENIIKNKYFWMLVKRKSFHSNCIVWRGHLL